MLYQRSHPSLSVAAIYLPLGILLAAAGLGAGENTRVRYMGTNAPECGGPSHNQAASLGSANAPDSSWRPHHRPETHGSVPGPARERTLPTSAPRPASCRDTQWLLHPAIPPIPPSSNRPL